MKWPQSLRIQTAAEQAAHFQVLTEEGQTYFNQILTEYQLQAPSQNPSPDEVEVRKIAGAIVAKPAETRTWGDLFGLELAVVKLESEGNLRRGAWSIRAKYRDLAGDKAYDAYQASNPPDPKTGNLDELRSDTLRILGEFHWIYAFAPLREKLRSRLTKLVFTITTVCVVVVLGIAAYAYFVFDDHALAGAKRVGIPVLPMVIAMGMIGGYISLQRRIQNAPSTGDPIVNIAELSNSQFSVYLAPISGAVFAVLLYIIFVGGLLKGPLFPEIASPEGKCEVVEIVKSRSGGNNADPGKSSAQNASGVTANEDTKPPSLGSEAADKKKCLATLDFTDFLKKTGPASGVHFAILLVWAFIAGFAERFVPDTIDHLVSQAAQK
jgi:hypothetical protein